MPNQLQQQNKMLETGILPGGYWVGGTLRMGLFSPQKTWSTQIFVLANIGKGISWLHH